MYHPLSEQKHHYGLLGNSPTESDQKSRGKKCLNQEPKRTEGHEQVKQQQQTQSPEEEQMYHDHEPHDEHGTQLASLDT